MTRMTRPDGAVMCNLINIHTYIHNYEYSTTVDKSTIETYRNRGLGKK